jgi:hypothetical protein
MLLKELKAFVEEGGRERLKQEHMRAVTLYESNFFANNATKKKDIRTDSRGQPTSLL